MYPHRSIVSPQKSLMSMRMRRGCRERDKRRNRGGEGVERGEMRGGRERGQGDGRERRRE